MGIGGRRRSYPAAFLFTFPTARAAIGGYAIYFVVIFSPRGTPSSQGDDTPENFVVGNRFTDEDRVHLTYSIGQSM
jgi:hypothetical protein